MPSQLPLGLALAWVMFFAAAVAQFHYEQIIRRVGPAGLLHAVEISQLLWLVSAVAILVYYFLAARWFCPLALALGGSLLGALLAGILLSTVGEKAAGTSDLMRHSHFPSWHFVAGRPNTRLFRDGEVPFIR
jgi:hypothetical protein